MNIPIENEFVEEHDITNLVSIGDLDGLQPDDVLDALENIYSQPIMNVTVEELLNDEHILPLIQQHQEEQKVVVLNSEDNTYWSCGNISCKKRNFTHKTFFV